MVRVGNAHHSLAIYISKKLKFNYYEKAEFNLQMQQNSD